MCVNIRVNIYVGGWVDGHGDGWGIEAQSNLSNWWPMTNPPRNVRLTCCSNWPGSRFMMSAASAPGDQCQTGLGQLGMNATQ